MKSWAELRAAVAAALLARGRESVSQAGLAPADEFLDLACLTYWNHTESPARIRRAEQLLARQPEITVDNLFVMAALGDAERVSALLEKQPALANVAGGPRDWVPLLYLCFARVTQLDSVSTLKALLSHGADPNAHYAWGEPANPGKSSALTGVFGLGENGPVAEPPHPNRSELSRLLLAAGADPNDAQTLYNCHFEPDNVFLEILFEYGLSVQSLEQGIGLGGVGYSWLLVHAAARGFTARVKLLLAHGVNPNATDREGRTAYAIALSAGHEAIAEDLARAGAERVTLSAEESFRAACWRGDIDGARALLAKTSATLGASPLLRRAAEGALVEACTRGRADVALFLLGEGVAVAPRADHLTALHAAAWHGHLELIALLLRHGAPLEAKNEYGGTVLDAVVWAACHSPVVGVDYVAVVETLLAAGADANAVSPFPSGSDVLDAVLSSHGAKIQA